MNFTKIGFLMLLLAQFLAPLVAQEGAPQDQRSELKDRMKARYALLEQLRDAGKVGETRDGEVKVVKAAFGAEQVDPKVPAKGTVAELVAAENKDRHSLYATMAKDLKITAAEVASQNGLRNLDKADPDHWVEVKAQWVQRKLLKPVGQDKK